jgi:hypothetical protein
MNWGICSLFLVVFLPSAEAQLQDVWQTVAKIKADEPRGVRFSLGDGLPEGGHLPGVQAIVQGNDSKLLLSGSSNDFSYILTVPMSARGDAKGILTKLLPLPCRHAGGFQLVEGRYAAIGLEDNRLKDTSKVWVVDVAAKDFGEPVKPVISIERHGQVERATAGAIAMAGLGKRHLLVVGTWDSATLDFYESNEYPLEDVRCRFEKAGTWSAADADRGNWSDATYGSYQNMNLIVDAQGRCFLAGFCRTGDVDHLDLDEWQRAEGTPISKQLIKRGTKSFRCVETTFRAGAGLQVTKDGSVVVYACSHREGVVEVFE